MLFGHIAVATDFSETADMALRTAVQLATKLGTRLTALTVGEQADLEATLRRALAKHGAPETARALVLQGKPAYSVVDWLESPETDADLLVCGALGKTGVSRILLGSFTEKVVRLSPCPVWVVRPEVDRPLPRRVLLSTDLERSSGRAWTVGLGLAEALGIPLEVLHVLPRPPFRFGHTPNLDDFYESARNEARRELEEALGQTPGVRLTIAAGEPAEQVLNAAPADGVVVCGTHGKANLERWIVGSVAEKLVHRAPSSVLVVPPHREDAALGERSAIPISRL